MTRSGIDRKWIRSVDDKLTFCGVYEQLYDACAKYWKQETTRTQYDRDYNDVILPSLSGHDSKAIDEYTMEDFEAAILSIAERGQTRKGQGGFVPYADSTLQHFRHLMEVVVTAAANHDLCDNVLWGSRFSLQESQLDEDAVNERVRLKKSLTISEEFAVAKALLSDPGQRGQNFGLLLMFALGLRNGEACGANFGDVRPMERHPECKVLWVYKTTISGKNTLQSSGKTKNADRIIPIPDVLDQFLEERRAYLEQSLSEDGAAASHIDELPIACVGDNFSLRCSAHQLTAAGREMFRRIKMSSAQLAYIDAELSDQETASELKEQDPSAYLLRRNFGTHLSILGLSESEIEYLIGHDIQDAYETRNEYVNEERLWLIKEKLDKRPILNRIDLSGRRRQMRLLAGNLYVLEGIPPQKYHFRTGNGRLLLHVFAKEPLDPLKIRVSSLSQAKGASKEVLPYSTPCSYGRTIDVLKKYHELYQLVSK